MENENVILRTGHFLREVRAEMRKVVWPGWRRTAILTGVVIVVCAVVVALIYVADLVFRFLFGL